MQDEDTRAETRTFILLGGRVATFGKSVTLTQRTSSHVITRRSSSRLLPSRVEKLCGRRLSADGGRLLPDLLAPAGKEKFRACTGLPRWSILHFASTFFPITSLACSTLSENGGIDDRCLSLSRRAQAFKKEAFIKDRLKGTPLYSLTPARRHEKTNRRDQRGCDSRVLRMPPSGAEPGKCSFRVGAFQRSELPARLQRIRF
jgi:hypothetical protein